MGELAERPLDLGDIMEEFHHVEAPGGDFACMVFLKQTWIVQTDKGGAGYRWSHCIVVPLEQVFEMSAQTYGLVLESRVGHRLAAAGLSLGIGNIVSQVFQQLIACHTHFRKHHVNVAGYKQTDFHSIDVL